MASSGYSSEFIKLRRDCIDMPVVSIEVIFELLEMRNLEWLKVRIDSVITFPRIASG